MKKIIFLAISCWLLAVSHSNAQYNPYTQGPYPVPRIGNLPNNDNTLRAATTDSWYHKTPSNDTIRVFGGFNITNYFFPADSGSLTASIKVICDTTKHRNPFANCNLGDEVKFVFLGDTASAGHTVTFGYGFHTSSTTISVGKQKVSVIVFINDGALTGWREEYRDVNAN